MKNGPSSVIFLLQLHLRYILRISLFNQSRHHLAFALRSSSKYRHPQPIESNISFKVTHRWGKRFLKNVLSIISMKPRSLYMPTPNSVLTNFVMAMGKCPEYYHNLKQSLFIHQFKDCSLLILSSKLLVLLK